MGNKVLELTEDIFQEEVLDAEVPVLVDFWAPWCGPCRMVAPIIEQLAASYPPDKLKVTKVNVDDNQELAMKYNVMSIPTLALFKDGQVVKRMVGFQPFERLQEEIEEVLVDE
ncbi:MAG TPA: thioredoxin [Firmicutes bacterium]|nr:thioredoxin [Bacillota bacterium]